MPSIRQAGNTACASTANHTPALVLVIVPCSTMAFTWGAALVVLVLSLSAADVHAVSSLSCGPCNKTMCPTQLCSGFNVHDVDHVPDACDCCKLCPLEEGEACGEDHSMRVRCHRGLSCVPHYNSTVGVCRRVTSTSDVCLSQPCGDGQQCVSQGDSFICKDLSCSPQHMYRGCNVDPTTGSCFCGETQHCVSPYKYQTRSQCSNRTSTFNCNIDTVQCVEDRRILCPIDSVHVPRSSGPTPGGCCKMPESCKCSQQHCNKFKPRCQYPGMKQVLVRSGNGVVPGLCCDVYDCMRDSVLKCPRGLQCPPNITCPPDSERITQPSTLQSCCPDPGYCVCKPCQVKCPDRHFPRLLENGTGTPSRCCPTYECQKDELHCQISGRRIEFGSTSWWPSQCEHCTCVQGLRTCSEIRCKRQKDCLNSYTPIGQCCPVCLNETMEDKLLNQDCKTKGGQTFKSGATWSISDCSHCICNNGVPNCQTPQCDYVGCAGKGIEEKVPGQCCPVCVIPHRQDDCIDEDTEVTRRHMEYWWRNGTCKECFCANGRVLCSEKPIHSCPLISCPDPVKPKGSCCSQCLKSPHLKSYSDTKQGLPKCVYHNTTYQVGDKWPGKHKCRQCECQENGLKHCDYITAESCPALSCSDGLSERVEGECCPVCSDDIKQKGLIPCSQVDCPLNCPLGHYPKPTPDHCCAVCKDPCEKKRCGPSQTCVLQDIGDQSFRARCMSRWKTSTTITTSLMTTTTTSLTTQSPTTQDMSVFYIYLVIEMVYSEFVKASEAFFPSDFSHFLSPGFHNVRVIVVRQEEFIYGPVDKVERLSITRFKRTTDGMTLVKILVQDEDGQFIPATKVVAVIEKNSNKFSENKQEFMVIRWFTEQQLKNEDIYKIITTDPVQVTDPQNQFGWTEYQSVEKHGIDLGLLAAYVVAAIVGSVCIAFLIISFSLGVHKKLKNRKGSMHNNNNTTGQTHQEVEELDTTEDRLQPADLSRYRSGLPTSKYDTSHTVSVNQTFHSVVDSVLETSSHARGQADSGCASRSSCAVSSSHSVEDEYDGAVISEATNSDKSRSPSPTPSQLLVLTVADASNAESHAVDASKSPVSTSHVQATPVTERVSTFV